jgi:DNA polymerase-3 subunit delta
LFTDENTKEEIMMELSVGSLLFSEKMIIIKSQKIYKNKKSDSDLINILKSIDDKIKVIFVYNGLNLSIENPLLNYLLENFIIKKTKELKRSDITKIIISIVESENGTISNKSAIIMSNFLPVNLRIIVNETKKLLSESKEVSLEMVQKSVSEYFEDESYGLVNAIIGHDIEDIIMAYQKKIKLGIDPILIISQIAGILNLANMINDYKLQGVSLYNIAAITKVHIFRIKNANKILEKHGSDQIKKLIKKLTDLDFKIKSGKIDKNIAMDYFILQII